MIYTLWDSLDFYFIIFGIFIYIIQFISYTYTFLKNPGIPINKEVNFEMKSEIEDWKNENNNDKNKKRGLQFCNICHIYVDTKCYTNHCEDCNVCVEGIFILY